VTISPSTGSTCVIFDLPFFAGAATNLHAPSVDPKVLA
jgi:hypothetical protein